MYRIPMTSAIVAIAAICTLASEAQAQLTGTLRGNIRARERRAVYSGTNCSGTTAGLLADHCGTHHPVRRARISLEVPGEGVITTITDSAGNFSITWSSALFPAFATLRVYWLRPLMAIGTQMEGWPADAFRITSGLSSARFSTAVPITLMGGVETRDVTFTGSEFTAAFAVADDVYSRVVNQSTALTNDMNGTFIHVNAGSLPGGGIGAFGGVTPDPNHVYLLPGTTMAAPEVTAHEIGHLIAWRELDVPMAPMLRGAGAPGSYVACDGTFVPSWTTFSTECEQPAHWEGFAILVQAAWAWTRSAPAPTIPRNDTGQDVSMEDELSCATTSLPHRRAQCHARALWDIYDTVDDGADTISGRSFISIGQHLRDYPDNCLWPFDNRCSNEGATGPVPDFDAMNHWDWMMNWPFSDSGTVQQIFFQNGLSGGDTN